MKAIYSILNKINNHRYIGSSVNFYNRKRLHLQELNSNKHHSTYLQSAWNKYGSENFEFIILEKIENKEDLIIREQWWIDNTPCEYNICKIAGSSLGIKRSNAFKEKLRKANIGLKHPEWRRKQKSISQGGVNHWQYGKKMSDETKKKKSEAMKKWYSENIPLRKGKKQSKEAIGKMRHKLMICVYQYDLQGNFIREWESATTAAKELNLKASNICACSKGKVKTAGGYIWKKEPHF